MEMMSWGTEILQHPTPDSNWFLEFPPHQQQLPGGVSRSWTAEENKVFEQALAIHDGDTPERWLRVAEITGKSVEDVKRHYSDLEQDVQQIESGLVPIPGYSSPAFTLDWAGSGSGSGSSHGGGGGRHPYGGGSGSGCGGGRRPGPGGGRGSDHERKKGVPWTEEEHRLFLLGLKKYGKGDWRSISRNYVQSRTPTQVASHAQKYFIRLSSGGKDKRRSSIHDITTVNVPDENSCTGTTTAASQHQQQQQAQQQLMSTPPPVGCTAAVTAAAQPEPPPLPPPQAPPVASAAAAVVEQFSTAAADAARIPEAALFDAMVSQARNNGSHLLAAASQYRHKIRESLAVSRHNLRFQMQSAPPHRVI